MLFRNTTNPSATQEVASTGGRFARRSVVLLAAFVLMAVTSATVSAQSMVPAFEIRPMAGAYIPLGQQKSFVNDATMLGAQASWLMTPSWALTGSLGWTRTEDRALSPATQKLNMYQYDAGIEARVNPSVGESWSFAPFLGVGAGARTYDYKASITESRTYFAGYGSVGGELAYKSVGVRLEARDYLSRYRPDFGSGAMDYRNDITVAAALNLRIW